MVKGLYTGSAFRKVLAAVVILGAEYALVRSLFHREASKHNSEPNQAKYHIPYSQSASAQYNLLAHCGGVGPFVSHSGYGIDPDVPEGYEVDQVHLLARHGERFPTRNDGREQAKLVEELQKIDAKQNTGPLAFLKDYKYFGSESDYEQLSRSGRFSGAVDAYHQGQAFRESYGHLYDPTYQFPVFAAGDKRVVDTASYFTQGFLAGNFTEKAALQVIPETRGQGANTLAPSTFCKTYKRNANDDIIASFSKSYLKNAKERLETLSPDYKGKLTESGIFKMMTICPFELNIRGESDWCHIFTEDEWLSYAYYRSLVFYYQASYGHDKSLGIGSNYVNATLNLLTSEDHEEKIFASFTHDTDMTPVLVPLGLFDDDGKELEPTHIDFNSHFKSSEIVPMGARFVIERLKALETGQDSDDEKFVRIKVGNSVVPLPGCDSGPGFSCKLSDFAKRVDKNLAGATYLNTCETDDDLPQHLSFFWDWKTEKYNENKVLRYPLV